MHRRTFIRHTAIAAGFSLGAKWPGDLLAGEAGVLAPNRPLDTPADHTLSPFTGYTRAHWLETAERLLAGVLPHLDPSTGLLRPVGVPGDRGHFEIIADNSQPMKWQAMERIMMLAVYYSAATGRDTVPGWSGSISQVFRTGITRMTDPADPLFCPRINPGVYMGSETALAAMLSPRLFWEPFSAAERGRILDSAGALAVQKAYDNNHHLFHLVPVPLLEREGRDAARAKLTPLLERVLGMYRGDGWFIDGNNGGFDHYNFWGFHLYLNALCHLDRPWREQYGGRIREISSAFLDRAPWFYGRDGGPIPWGRSLAYRFADLSGLHWAWLNGACQLAPGLARRMASGCLKYFWDRGALHDTGLLETGYHGPNAVVAEPYVSHGTGYFAAQAFSCLLIPENDPFWTDKEQPLPADGQGGRLALPAAEMTVRVSPIDGEARLFVAGQRFTHPGSWQRGIKYCQHAYSGSLGWCALGDRGEDLGAGRAGWSFDGKNWKYRVHPVATLVEADQVASHEPMPEQPGPAGELHTHTLIGDTGEMQIIWHTRAQPTHLHFGGYSVSVAAGRQPGTTLTGRGIHLTATDWHSWMEQLRGPAGRFEARLLEPRSGWMHSHLFGGHGAYPFWRSLEPVPPFEPVVLYLDGSRNRLPATPAIVIDRTGPALQIDFGGSRTEIMIRRAAGAG